MSGVVLRCSNCGTVQAAPGECEACREAQVRYFCTNHDPGVWLDAPACEQCGARFGVTRPAASARPPRTSDQSSVAREPSGRLPDHDLVTDPLDGPPYERESASDRDPRSYPDPLPSAWMELLVRAARASRAREVRPAFRDEEARPGSSGGCLGRFLILALFLIALFALAPLLLGTMFLRLL